MTRRAPSGLPPWPSCPCCGGPARPLGEPQLSLRFEVETRSEANERCNRFKKSERKRNQRERTLEEVEAALGAGQRLPAVGPWYVRLTRVAPNRLDRDNLARSLKAVQDAVAAVLGVDDGDEAVWFAHEQRRGGTHGEPGCPPSFLGVRIEAWGELGARGIGWVGAPPFSTDELERLHVPTRPALPDGARWAGPTLVPRWAAALLGAAREASGSSIGALDDRLGLRAVVDAALRAPDPEEYARAACSALRVSGMSAALTLGGP